jgi:hypothetical protein
MGSEPPRRNLASDKSRQKEEVKGAGPLCWEVCRVF